MFIKQGMESGKIVKKSNALARARWSPDSVWEPRLVAMLASQIKSGDTDFQTYEIRLADLLGKEPGGKDYKELKEAIYKAMSRVIIINDSNGWSMYNLFSKCKLDNQKCTLEVCFHPDLKEHYLNLKQYIKYDVIEFMILPSIYSQRVFEFLKSWDDKSEIIIPLIDLHEMLNTPKSLREKYKDFRVRVLDKAHKDILNFTKLSYTWEAIKKGRSVVEIKFLFNKKQKSNNHINSKSALFIQEALGDNEHTHKTCAYPAFLAKFPNKEGKIIDIGNLWFELDKQGIAPLAKDVPDNNELSAFEFLKRWKISHININNK